VPRESLRRPPEPRDLQRPAMLAALTLHDVTGVFRQLQKIGFSQQRIAALTGQAQPEVSAIIHGRKVMAYDLLHRVFESLGVPMCLVGMASCCDCCPHQPPGGTMAPGRVEPILPPLRPITAGTSDPGTEVQRQQNGHLGGRLLG
jgi:transcriptional regulator with XRE-family HTH domain